MNKNVKRIFFVLAFVMLLVTVGAVCAADDANSTSTASDTGVSDAVTVTDTASDTVAAESVTTNIYEDDADSYAINNARRRADVMLSPSVTNAFFRQQIKQGKDPVDIKKDSELSKMLDTVVKSETLRGNHL